MTVRVPAFILRKLYVPGSLRRADGALRFTLRNTLANATLVGLRRLRLGGEDVPPERVAVRLGGREVAAPEVADGAPLPFPRGAEAEVAVRGAAVHGRLRVRLEAQSREFGPLDFDFEDDVAAEAPPT